MYLSESLEDLDAEYRGLVVGGNLEGMESLKVLKLAKYLQIRRSFASGDVLNWVSPADHQRWKLNESRQRTKLEGLHKMGRPSSSAPQRGREGGIK
jgi:hypothetical protein